MNKKRKKINYRRIIGLAVVFLIVIIITLVTMIVRQESDKKTYDFMGEATLPTLTLDYLEGRSTELFGYARKMNLVDMRDVIVPLDENHGLGVTVTSYGNSLDSLTYQVRSLNGRDFLEEQTVNQLREKDGQASVHIQLSDLLKNNTEYVVEFTLNTGEKQVYFYTRVISAKTMYTKEMLDFSEQFSNATFHKDTESEFIVNYIQPDNTSSTDDFYYTSIHSKYSMFTWGDMDIKRLDNTRMRITELEPTQLSVTLYYQVEITNGKIINTYDVEEFFCVRYRAEKLYLLDYSRTLEQEFEMNSSEVEKGKITLGIGEGQCQLVNSPDKKITAFAQNRQVWSYQSDTNAMNLIFSFKDRSERSANKEHDVQIVKVTDAGEIDYMVYGYMNRGMYEGQVGISFYRFNTKENSTECLFFMPLDESEQILMMDLGSLVYVNSNDVCYLRYGNGIYAIDLKSGENVEVTLRAFPGAYAINEAGNIVVWQDGEDLDYPDRLSILNMDSETTQVIDADDGDYVRIMDFIGQDIVYGFGRKTDSITQANMDKMKLLYHINIVSSDLDLKVQQSYEAKDSYISGAEIYENRVVINRVSKTGNTVTPLDNDYLILSQETDKVTGKSVLFTQQDATLLKQYFIQIGVISEGSIQFSSTSPRFEVDSGANEIHLTRQQKNVYYVYGYGKLQAVESKLSDAINLAYDDLGVVVDDNMNYLWTRGTRDLFKSISIQSYTQGEGTTSLGVSLQILCAQDGKQLEDADAKLNAGETPVEIINGMLGDRGIDLYECSLSQVLYFVNQGHPVLAVMGDREGLVIFGYETTNVSVYNPETGESRKVPLEEATALFEENGNYFMSYQ